MREDKSIGAPSTIFQFHEQDEATVLERAEYIERPNTQMEPTRQSAYVIVSLRRAAHLQP